MTTLSKTIRTSVAAVLMLAGVTTSAQGQGAAGVSAFGVGGKGVMQIRGSVVCVGCSLAEAREAQPGEHRLYQFVHRQGQVVMKVSWVNNNSQRWSQSVLPRIWLRAEDSLLQKLTAEENLFKEVEITGILSNSRTLDIGRVTIRG